MSGFSSRPYKPQTLKSFRQIPYSHTACGHAQDEIGNIAPHQAESLLCALPRHRFQLDALKNRLRDTLATNDAPGEVSQRWVSPVILVV